MGEIKNYKIALYGCDDSTIFEMGLSREEYDLLARVAKRSMEVSTYGCMPILQIEEIIND